MRAWLFVPGDRPDRMAKAMTSGADALILDLEDSVAADRKEDARAAIARFIAAQDGSGPALWVRINPLDSGLADADVAAIAPAGPAGIVLPKAEGGTSIADLDARLAAYDPAARIALMPIASETASAVFACGSYKGSSPRLAALTWGAEDLPAAIGAHAREPDGRYTPLIETVRALAALGAHAAGVAAIETVYPAFRDLDGLAAYAARGRRDGFTGMLAIHPTQVPVINAAFSPSEAEIVRARAILALFDANPGAGALTFEGAMVDAPHLKTARGVIALASRR